MPKPLEAIDSATKFMKGARTFLLGASEIALGLQENVLPETADIISTEASTPSIVMGILTILFRFWTSTPIFKKEF